MSDNPFAEPEDSDRTVIRPAPGGRRATPIPAPDQAAAPRQAAAPVADVDAVATGANPLAAAAAPLLQLLARLRNTASPPDAGDLRERAVRELRRFEQRAREADIPPDQLRTAHYALCASLDDVVLATPWGSAGGWDARSLVSTFHQEVSGGERFFDLLRQMGEAPARNLPVLELMYLCLSLGFVGRYRLSPRGPGEIDRLREETYAVLMRQRQAAPPEFAPHWKGVAAPYRPARARVPLWVGASAGLAVLAGLFLWVSDGLGAASDDVYARLLAAPPAQMPAITRAALVVPPPPPPAAPEPTVLDRLRGFLQPEIEQKLVTVAGTPAAPLIRINNRGMFPSGSATLQTGVLPLLERVGMALRDEPGRVLVIGYTDNQPIRTVRFPSNFQLSSARAEAARAVIARAVGDPARLAAEGRADADPLAPNTTAEGREANRRIEVVLRRSEP